MTDEAYQRGYATADLLSNPYPDGSLEARRFVDGWVAGRKWERKDPLQTLTDFDQERGL